MVHCSASQRPIAKELLQHRFIKNARRTSQLFELVERYRDWRAKTPAKSSSKGGKGAIDPFADEEGGGTVASAWAFDTVRSQSQVETTSAAAPRATVQFVSLQQASVPNTVRTDSDAGHQRSLGPPIRILQLSRPPPHKSAPTGPVRVFLLRSTRHGLITRIETVRFKRRAVVKAVKAAGELIPPCRCTL